MIERITTPQARQWFYTVAAAALAVAVYYGFVHADAVPLWLGLVAAIGALGNGGAAVVVKSQRRDGTLE